MNYFSKDFLVFFQELKKNNNAVWFNENRNRYEKVVKEPFQQFVTEMIKRIRKEDASVNIDAKDAIFRINKDVRFSKDKEPYKTYVAANISEAGKKSKEIPGLYFQCGPDNVVVAGGVYVAEKDNLAKIRTAILDNMSLFKNLINEPAFKNKYGLIKGERLKRMPADLQDKLMQQPLIANKQFFYETHLKADIILQANLPELIMEYFRAAKKLNEFFKKAL